MNKTQQQKDGTVQRTKDVIDIDAVVPDDDRKENQPKIKALNNEY